MRVALPAIVAAAVPAHAFSLSGLLGEPEDPSWTKWYGGYGEQTELAQCPPGAWLSGFTNMNCRVLARGFSGVCSDGTVLPHFGAKGDRNVTLMHPAQVVTLRSCAAVDQLAGCGGTGGDAYTAECDTGRAIKGVQAKASKYGLRAVRFKCEPLLAEGREMATFSLGCFWNAHAAFADLPGVENVEMGYTGGWTQNPTPAAVDGGATGHVESVRVTFNTDKTDFGRLLEVFWKAHNPTQRGGQGKDVGTQFRSAIWVHSPKQRFLARQAMQKRQQAVTDISGAKTFYVARRRRHCKTMREEGRDV
eukprot:TRINITY_DN6964_c0_g1_i3.p2 TRINITY_DN6964_c0_g1~~TRINITY_DN6964_c0_g1_i3.p2  ORF type:complete len:324 (+),score=35.68 TRINITY_DN6964_c0_g1_i3:58-972(+)